MRVLDWNEFKNAQNQSKHKVGFEAAERFDWEFAVVRSDDRENYGEHREPAYGFIGDVLHVLVFTERDGITWIISLRKAEPRERKFYAEATRRQKNR